MWPGWEKSLETPDLGTLCSTNRKDAHTGIAHAPNRKANLEVLVTTWLPMSVWLRDQAWPRWVVSAEQMRRSSQGHLSLSDGEVLALLVMQAAYSERQTRECRTHFGEQVLAEKGGGQDGRSALKVRSRPKGSIPQWIFITVSKQMLIMPITHTRQFERGKVKLPIFPLASLQM